MPAFHSGFVAIVGRPNVGKSTLMNAMIGEKIAIVSSRPQTTRNRIMGVCTDEHSQIVFLDTPGLHTPHSRLGEYMVKAARDAVGSVKKSAARHGVEMRADYDAFQPGLSSAQNSVQVARRVARGLHAVFAHHRLRNVHSLEIFWAVTGARVRAVFVAPRAPYRFQYLVYLIH